MRRQVKDDSSARGMRSLRCKEDPEVNHDSFEPKK
jgi:hypothetical protein